MSISEQTIIGQAWERTMLTAKWALIWALAR